MMRRKKLAVIFGGLSTEHGVSVVSGSSVIKNLNKDKYNIMPIYIDLNGNWFRYTKNINEIDILEMGEEPVELEKIEEPINLLKSMDVVFPVLHGLYGEDGTIQGMLELLKVPYVGCGVLGSCLCMDKVYAKIILEKAQINQAKYIYIQKKENSYVYIDEIMNEHKLELNEVCKIIAKKLGFPVFIKPSNSGSSVGINKAMTLKELENAIICAGKYDKKIVIEENVNAREIECAVIGNDNVEASILGEILPAEDFYSFDAKYNNSESSVEIPANLSKELTEEIRRMAIKAYKAVDARGLSRVDFFVEKNSNKIYLNEINTMPGFTTISMYPQLWANCGKTYAELLDELIENASHM